MMHKFWTGPATSAEGPGLFMSTRCARHARRDRCTNSDSRSAVATVTAVTDPPDVSVARKARARPARPEPLHAEYARSAIAASASGRLSSERVVIASALVTPLRRFSAATLRSRRRTKCPMAKKAPLPGRSCHAATGASIVPWRQPGDRAINPSDRPSPTGYSGREEPGCP
jgi:hypothetical protein